MYKTSISIFSKTLKHNYRTYISGKYKHSATKLKNKFVCDVASTARNLRSKFGTKNLL